MPIDTRNVITIGSQNVPKQENGTNYEISREGRIYTFPTANVANFQNPRVERANHGVPRGNESGIQHYAVTNGVAHNAEVENKSNRLKLPPIGRRM